MHVETMSKEEQNKNRALFIHSQNIGGAPILDSSPKAYCQLTEEVCVAEGPSFWDVIFGKTVSCGNAAGITLNEQRLYRCPSSNYKK